MTPYLLLVVLAPLALTLLLRELAPIDLLLKRPLSCDLCMSCWTSLAIRLLVIDLNGALEPGVLLSEAGAGATVTYFLLKLAAVIEKLLARV
jgi:hypothetical protein